MPQSTNTASPLLFEIADRLSDPQAALLAIGEAMLLDTEERFRTQTSPDGAAWAALAASTLKRKKNPSILTEKGDLRGSIGYRIEGAADGASVIAGPSATLLYAAIHQFGGTVNHPGGTPYIPSGEGKGPFAGSVTFLRKDGTYPEGVRFTEPHTIPIPARPYLGISEALLLDIEEIVTDHVLPQA